MIHIKFSELVGNAFVNYLSRTGKHVLSLNTIYEYGLAVFNSLKADGINAFLPFYREEIDRFFLKYPEYFTFVESDYLIVLNKNIYLDELIEKFSNYLSRQELIAFAKEENVDILLKNDVTTNILLGVKSTKSFIGRLTYVQIQTFLEKLYPVSDGYYTCFCKTPNIDKYDVIAISYKMEINFVQTIILEEYQANIKQPEKWIKYLTEIFGEEYHRAFLEYGCSIPDED